MEATETSLPDNVWDVIIAFRDTAETVLANVDNASSELVVREAVDILAAAVGSDPFRLQILTDTIHEKIVGSLRWKSIAVSFYM